MKRYPEIIILDLDDKATVYSFTLPVDTKSYTLKTRGNTEFKLAYVPGTAGAINENYITIPSGSGESEDNLNPENPLTLYVQGEVNNEKLEIKRWR